MSTVLRPVGPKSAAVYWRRRLTLLGILVAIIAFIVVIIAQPWAGNAGQEDPVAAPGATASAAPAAPTQSNPAPAEAPAPTPAEEPAAVAQPAAQPPTCGPADVSVRAITDADSYSTGVAVGLAFAVTNVSSTPCVMNAGTTRQVFTISSGDDVYWRSTDCQTGATDTLALLDPGVEVTSSAVAWDRTRSATDTCGSERTPVPTGGASYHLKVTVDGRESPQSKQFLLY